MKRYILFISAILVATSFFLSSCKEKKPQFTIMGTISNSDSTTLYLERRGLTETTTIDSVKLNKEGMYKFEEDIQGYSEFYLLRLGNQVINVAIDSIESVTINSSKENFATSYSVEGSEATKQIKEVALAQYKLQHNLLELNRQAASKKIQEVAYIDSLQTLVFNHKSEATKIINSDYRSMSAYFTLFQQVGEYTVFDPMDKEDIPLFRAVATVWEQYRPASPRSEHLRNYTLKALAQTKRMNINEESLLKRLSEATENSVSYEISLPDTYNKTKTLSSLKGKVAILDFTSYKNEYSPAHNIWLNNIYEKVKSYTEIYQVSFDSDLHYWQNTANNLPWICVRDEASGTASGIMSKFNIFELPTIYLINKEGDLVKRIMPNDDIIKEINKLR